MKIDVRIDKMFVGDKSAGNIKAYASASFGDAYAIHGIKVLSGEKGLFASMPSIKGTDGKFHDTFHAITSDARLELNDAVLAGYRQELSCMQSEIAALSSASEESQENPRQEDPEWNSPGEAATPETSHGMQL